jgi:regulator of cell morphogenesis and NO signaling
MKQTHASYSFETMSPEDIMDYLSSRHYMALERLMEQIDEHLSEILRTDSRYEAHIFNIDVEYRDLAVLVKEQMKRNEELLFPFIYRILKEGLNNFTNMDTLEAEVAVMHGRHMEMRTHLANLSELAQGYKSGPEAGDTLFVLYSELHSFESHLYRLFYLEAVLLMSRLNTARFQSITQFYIE